MPGTRNERFLLVSGDFTPLGGMDSANHALAKKLALREGTEVHLVTHRAWPDLAGLPNVIVHKVPKLLGSYLASGPVLDAAGRNWAKRLTRLGARVVVNGGNCLWNDVNWVHYVHAAYTPQTDGSLLQRLKAKAGHSYFCHAERINLRNAGLIITNSKRTKRDVIDLLDVPAERVHAVYYGTDPKRFAPVTSAERTQARTALGWGSDRPVVVFVGALGDRRKGFDTLFAAWQAMCQDKGWDCDLAVIGAGRELSVWKRRASEAGLAGRIKFLGFRQDVPFVLAACDVLVHPARYEAYGLAVQEALCRGLPALVSADAGVAERYPEELHWLLIPNPDNTADLIDRLQAWRQDIDRARAMVAPLSDSLRSHTWEKMAAQIISLFQLTP